MTLEQAIAYAQDYLPKGWLMSLEIKTGFAAVKLFDDAGWFILGYEFSREVPTAERLYELVQAAAARVGAAN